MRTPTGGGRVAAVALLLLVLVGCGSPAIAPGPAAPVPPAVASAEPAGTLSASRPAAPVPPPAATVEPSGPLSASRPAEVIIAALGVDTSVMELGLRRDGTMEVPPDGSSAGWYDRSPTPGETGPAVLAAHVDWKGEQGVFFRLHELDPGDEVRVLRHDGVTAVFAVRTVEQYPKDTFPSTRVYGDVDGPELRLITCGGEFDGAARSYRDNIVVYAELVGIAQG